MRKTKKPYSLIMDGKLVDFLATLQIALERGQLINKNRMKSGGDDMKQSIKIYYEQAGEEQRLVHEE